MWVGLLTDRINNKLERRNSINEHALNREPVPLKEMKTPVPLNVMTMRSMLFPLTPASMVKVRSRK